MKKKIIIPIISIIIILFIIFISNYNKEIIIKNPKYSETKLGIDIKNNKLIKSKNDVPKGYPEEYNEDKLDFSKYFYIFYSGKDASKLGELDGVNSVVIKGDTITVNAKVKTSCKSDECAYIVYSYLIRIDKNKIDNNKDYKIVGKIGG